MRNVHIAAAVATGLALGGAAFAAPPTPSAAQGAAHQIFMAGSSAAANGVVAFLEQTICGNTGYSVFTTPTSTPGLPDFRAVSCSPAANEPFSGSTLTVWYRPEGGSVVGVLPVINNTSIKQLSMTAAGCTLTSSATAATAAYNCTGVGGTTPGNGTDDSFGTGTFSHNVDVGVSDLEPGAFGNTTIGATKAWAGGGNNDPFGTYTAAFTGPDQGPAALQAMTHTTVFQQVFGFVVSTNLGITSLPKEQIAGIFDALVTDWSNVATGATSSATVTATSTPIVICNREIGSGTRAEADVFLNGDGCNGVGSLQVLTDVAGAVIGTVTEPNDNFQTAAELDCVNRNANAIGYVSIDNFSKLGTTVAPNVNAIAVSGTPASQLNGATGVYSDVFEASLNENASASADGKTWYTDLVPILQAVNTTPKSGQVLAIPGQPAGNTASLPLQVGSPSTEFTSLFNRGGGAGNSCTPLTPQL